MFDNTLYRDELAHDLEPDERRLSSVTVVKSAPYLDASTLPDVSQMLDALDQNFDLSPAKGMPHLEIRQSVIMEQATKLFFSHSGSCCSS